MVFIFAHQRQRGLFQAVSHGLGRRDALSQQFGELLVAKANEGDALGNTEVGLCRCRFPKQKPHSKMCGFSFGQHS